VRELQLPADSVSAGVVPPVLGASVAQARAGRSPGQPCPNAAYPIGQEPCSVSCSYFEVEVGRGMITVYERMGDGQTELLVKMLRELGLDMRVRVSSPCG
jgi:hypothetical protein